MSAPCDPERRTTCLKAGMSGGERDEWPTYVTAQDPLSNLLVQVELVMALFFSCMACFPYSIAYAEHQAQRQYVPFLKSLV